MLLLPCTFSGSPVTQSKSQRPHSQWPKAPTRLGSWLPPSRLLPHFHSLHTDLLTGFYFILSLIIFYWLILEKEEGRGREREGGGREREREKHQFAVPLIYAFIGWFLYVPWLDVEPTTSAYRVEAINGGATGQVLLIILQVHQHVPTSGPLHWLFFLECSAPVPTRQAPSLTSGL